MADVIHQVRGDDGRIHRVRGPANASPEEILRVVEEGLRSQMELQPDAPPVDPATENMDPRDLQARNVPFDPRAADMNRRALRGLYKPVMGGVQTVANMVGGEPANVVNRLVNREEQSYQNARAAAGQTGMDVAGAIGQGAGLAIPATAAFKSLNALKGLSGFVARTLAGGATGAAAGLIEPEAGSGDAPVSPEEYWAGKAERAPEDAAMGLLMGPAAELTARAAAPAVNKVVNTVRNRRAAAAERAGEPMRVVGDELRQVNANLQQMLQKQGVDLAALPQQAREAMQKEALAAMQMGQPLDPERLARLADFEALGIKPLSAWVTRKPEDFSRQMNLASTQANTGGGAAMEAVAAGNRRLGEALGERASNLDDIVASRTVLGSLLRSDVKRQTQVNNLYKQAREIQGGDIPLDTRGRINDVIVDLERNGQLNKLTGTGREIVNNVLNKGVPITVGRAEGMKTSLATEMRDLRTQGKKAEALVLQKVYQVLEEADPAVQLGAEAMRAFRAARDANRRMMTIRENIPALKAAVDIEDPDKFFRQYILSGADSSVRNVAALREYLRREGNTEALDMLRRQTLEHLLRKATPGMRQATPGTTMNSAALVKDPDAAFSQAALRREIENIGAEKLRLLLPKEDLALLAAIERASSNMKTAPGAIPGAVGYSGTGAMVAGLAERIASIIPGGQTVSASARAATAIGKPVRDVMTERNALKRTRAFDMPEDVIDAEALRAVSPLGALLGYSFAGQ